MSSKLMGRVFDLDLPAKEKLLLLALADRGNEFGTSIYPSVATMSRMTSMPERTLQRVLLRLRGLGLLQIVEPATKKRPPMYRITLGGVSERLQPDYSTCPAPLRREVIEAFDQTCAYCRQEGSDEHGPDGTPWNVERLTPGSRGGTYEPHNVALSCRPCGARKGAKLAPDHRRSLGDLRAEETRQFGTGMGAMVAPLRCQPGAVGVPNQTEVGCQALAPKPLEEKPSVEPLGEKPPPKTDDQILASMPTLTPDVLPFVTAWVNRQGGFPNIGGVRRMLDNLKSLGNRHGDILARWRIYLDPAQNADNPLYLSTEHFQQHYALYDPAKPEARSRQSRNANDDIATVMAEADRIAERKAAGG